MMWTRNNKPGKVLPGLLLSSSLVLSYFCFWAKYRKVPVTPNNTRTTEP